MSESMQPTDEINQIKALRWQCRRGMLELDILLLRFLDNHYQHLPVKGQEQFASLLTAPDPELYAWLVAGIVPPPPFKDIVDAIRFPAKS